MMFNWIKPFGGDKNKTPFLVLKKQLYVPVDGMFIGGTVEYLDIRTQKKNSKLITHEQPVFMTDLNEE